MSESDLKKNTSNASPRIAYTTDGKMYTLCLSDNELKEVGKSLKVGIQIKYIKETISLLCFGTQ